MSESVLVFQTAAGASGGGSCCRGDGKEGCRGGRPTAGGGAFSQDRYRNAARVQRAVSSNHFWIYLAYKFIKFIPVTVCCLFPTDCPTSWRRRMRTTQSKFWPGISYLLVAPAASTESDTAGSVLRFRRSQSVTVILQRHKSPRGVSTPCCNPL